MNTGIPEHFMSLPKKMHGRKRDSRIRSMLVSKGLDRFGKAIALRLKSQC
jgi:hypothetical protein